VPIQSSKENALTIVPCESDVLSGKSKFCFRHSGNQTFRVVIAENVKAYKMAPTKKLKMHIVIAIAEEMRFRGGRFLFQDSQGCWKDGGITLGKKKVGNAFRDAQRGRLRLKTQNFIDDSVCAVSPRPSSQRRDDKNNSSLNQVGKQMLPGLTSNESLQEYIDQQSDSNDDLLPEAYHKNEWINLLDIQKSFTLEPTVELKSGITEKVLKKEFLDDFSFDELSQLLKY
jgi:hypothetical protein